MCIPVGRPASGERGVSSARCSGFQWDFCWPWNGYRGRIEEAEFRSDSLRFVLHYGVAEFEGIWINSILQLFFRCVHDD